MEKLKDFASDMAETEEGIADEGGIVFCSSGVSDDLGEFSKLFDHPASLREAARFAMAVGIQADRRTPRETWGKGKPRNIAHLNGQFDEGGRYDFALLFEMLGLRREDVPLNVLISEYITGGMEWISENEISTGVNFSQLRDTFGHLFQTSEKPGVQDPVAPR